MSELRTREAHSQWSVDMRESKGLTQLGLHANQVWHDDPKQLVFRLSRYKFVAKMLSGMRNVLEVGCGDAFCSRIVLQEVGSLMAVDFEPVFVADVLERMDDRWKFECKVHDILDGPVDGIFDAAYALDVMEHIPKDQEDRFLLNIVSSLKDTGVLIIGMPSLQSQVCASALSKQGHVNCKDYKELKAFLSRFFFNVFIFSVNDEVVHTGFYQMAHYLLALCCCKKSDGGKQNGWEEG